MKASKNFLILILILIIVSFIGYILGKIDFDFLILVIGISLLVVYYCLKKINEKNKYLLFTDESLKLLNDKEGHIDIYYEVDLGKNIVIKRKDTYENFKGKVKEEVLKKYKISKTKNKKIERIFNEIINNMDKEVSNSKNNRKFYVLRMSDGFEVITYDLDLINEFESMFK